MEIHGLEELQRDLKDNITLDDVKRVVQTNGARLSRKMKEQTKMSYVKGHSTGDTASSINAEPRNGGLSVAVGSTMSYTPYVEFGTRYMSAEPVVQPALQAVYPQFFRDIERMMK